jgi:hypothetical protein
MQTVSVPPVGATVVDLKIEGAGQRDVSGRNRDQQNNARAWLRSVDERHVLCSCREVLAKALAGEVEISAK